MQHPPLGPAAGPSRHSHPYHQHSHQPRRSISIFFVFRAVAASTANIIAATGAPEARADRSISFQLGFSSGCA